MSNLFEKSSKVCHLIRLPRELLFFFYSPPQYKKSVFLFSITSGVLTRGAERPHDKQHTEGVCSSNQRERERHCWVSSAVHSAISCQHARSTLTVHLGKEPYSLPHPLLSLPPFLSLSFSILLSLPLT